MKEPLTMQEVKMRIDEDTREELLGYLQTGDVIGKEIKIHIGHYTGELGVFICEIKKWEKNHEATS